MARLGLQEITYNRALAVVARGREAVEIPHRSISGASWHDVADVAALAWIAADARHGCGRDDVTGSWDSSRHKNWPRAGLAALWIGQAGIFCRSMCDNFAARVVVVKLLLLASLV